MAPTILLDLDDTLLVNDIDSFLPVYLSKLSDALLDYTEPEKMVRLLLAATNQMLSNRRPDCTLKQVFDAAFFPGLGLKPENLQGPIEAFYTQIFPSLRELTRPIPAAVALVEEAFRRDCRVVVATNPLFPRSAIIQRLEWAELSPDRYAFEFITSYEDMHFTKPHAAYYAEILARLGWPEEPAVMIGDDRKNDILPAARLGLPAYWISDRPLEAAENAPPAASGNLEDFWTWLDGLSPQEMHPELDHTTGLLAVLRSTPAALHTACRGLPAEKWNHRPLQNEWAPNEILCHLRDVEKEVNLPRLEKVLNEEKPFLAGRDTDPWAEERRYIEQNGPEALNGFLQARLKVLDLLENMPPDSWQRTARHAIFGPTTLQELVAIMAGHDRIHVRQLLRYTKSQA